MEEMFANPFWYALKTEQAAFAVGEGKALRYPADVLAFAALKDSTTEAMNDLASLMVSDEIVYVVAANLSVVDGLAQPKQLPCLQMQFQGELTEETAHGPEVVMLDGADAPNMVALTDIAFPGFFRSRTYALGSYFGIHVGGQLVAMAGERISLPGYCEISAVCAHPDHTGKGYAASLIRHLLRLHAAAGISSFLHVSAVNERAITLYERLGFIRTCEVLVHQLRRVE
jgi:predicted GNAT family acetyltransferase